MHLNNFSYYQFDIPGLPVIFLTNNNTLHMVPISQSMTPCYHFHTMSNKHVSVTNPSLSFDQQKDSIR